MPAIIISLALYQIRAIISFYQIRGVKSRMKLIRVYYKAVRIPIIWTLQVCREAIQAGIPTIFDLEQPHVAEFSYGSSS